MMPEPPSNLGSEKRSRRSWVMITVTVMFLSLSSKSWTAELRFASAPIPQVSPEAAGFSRTRLARLNRWVEGQIAAKREAGAVVLIARNGKIVELRSFGWANMATRAPMKVNDLFRLYSMTKPVTAVALLTLYERGKFQLTDPLSRYLPEFSHVKVFAGLTAHGRIIRVKPKRPITIEDLLRHTAGFTYAIFGNTPVDKAYRAAGIEYGKVRSVRQLTADLAREPLLYQPGRRWVYSFSYDVIADLVERLSGMSFASYCRKVIFKPLGMRHTVFGQPPQMTDRFPVLYTMNAAHHLVTLPANENFYPQMTRHAFGGVSLSSTPRDYLRFAQMLLNGGQLQGVRILAPATVALMTSNAIPRGTRSFAPGIGYGFGVSVLEDPTLNGTLGYRGDYGWSGYATTNFLVDPHKKLIAMIFAQRMPGSGRFTGTFQTLVFQALVH